LPLDRAESGTVEGQSARSGRRASSTVRARIGGMSELPEVEYVQPRVVHNQRILLAGPDPGWPVDYANVEARIRAALGPRAVRVEHVGSTSIKGLVAKPIIDVLLLVAEPVDESAYVPDLEAAGFVLTIREPDWHEHRLFKGRSPDVNLHVFATGSAEAERMLLFRDWLRIRADEVEGYAAVKKDLAAQEWEYVQDYADAKSVVVEEILLRARSGLGT
jgi:GrpB-like predicted nucleotidyltransferase (UPF0157 family)